MIDCALFSQLLIFQTQQEDRAREVAQCMRQPVLIEQMPDKSWRVWTNQAAGRRDVK